MQELGEVVRGGDDEQEQQIGEKITTIEPGFHLHRTLLRFFENRRKAVDKIVS